MGAVLREQNALLYGEWITIKLTAKDDVDNVGAGRAAKGAKVGAKVDANLIIPFTNYLRCFFLAYLINTIGCIFILPPL